MHTCRPYQTECLQAIRSGLQTYDSVCVELATGTGKTVIFTKLASEWSDGRVMVVAPMLTLLPQAAKKIHAETGFWPAIEQASQWSPEHEHAIRADFVVASKQTLVSGGSGWKRFERFSDIGLLIIDECHYTGTSAYRQMIEHFRAQGTKILGVSATVKRNDGKSLGEIFDACVYQYGIREAVADGYLVKPKIKAVNVKNLTLSNITSRPQAGSFGCQDYVLRELEEKMIDKKVVAEVVEGTAKTTGGMKTLMFAPSIAVAESICLALENLHGIPATWICSDTRKCSKQDVQDRMLAFTSGDVTHMVNVNMLSTGWDFPGLQAIVMASPTRSQPLYIQRAGRVTRPLDGLLDGLERAEDRLDAIANSAKPYGLIVDLVDASRDKNLCTGPSVLEGTPWDIIDDGVLEEMADEGIDLEEALERQHQRDLERQAQAAAARRQKEFWKQQQIEAELSSHDRDPFADPEWARPDRVRKVPPASVQQRAALWVRGWKEVDQYQFNRNQARSFFIYLDSGGDPSGIPKRYHLQPNEPQDIFRLCVKKAARAGKPLRSASGYFKSITGSWPSDTVTQMPRNDPRWTEPASRFC